MLSATLHLQGLALQADQQRRQNMFQSAILAISQHTISSSASTTLSDVHELVAPSKTVRSIMIFVKSLQLPLLLRRSRKRHSPVLETQANVLLLSRRSLAWQRTKGITMNLCQKHVPKMVVIQTSYTPLTERTLFIEMQCILGSHQLSALSRIALPQHLFTDSSTLSSI